MKGRSRFRFRYRGIMSALGGIIDTTSKLLLDLFANDFEVANEVSTFNQTVSHSASTNGTMTGGYGAELVQEAGFTSPGGETTIVGTTITHEHVSGAVIDTFTTQVEAGKQYKIIISNVSFTGTCELRIKSSGSGTDFTLTLANGTSNLTPYVWVPQTSGSLELRWFGSTAETCVLDLSVREMPAIKWRPHNLVRYSEDFSNAAWVAGPSGTGTIDTKIAAAGIAPDGTNTASRLVLNLNGGTTASDIALVRQAGGAAGQKTQAKFWVRSFDGSSTYTAQIVDYNGLASTINITGEWQLFENVSGVQAGVINHGIRLRGGQTPTNSDVADILIWGAHLYRSDLGGMVDNPDRGDSYVPTTSSAVYLPRRGHHIYNGYEWVNEGMLHESEARTNQVDYSLNVSASGVYYGWQRIRDANNWVDSTQVGPAGTIDDVIDINALGGAGYTAIYAYLHSSAGVCTTSAYVKAGTFSLVNMAVRDGYAARFDLAAGTVLEEETDVFATITDVGNGWYRLSVTCLNAITTNASYILLAAADGTALASLDGYGRGNVTTTAGDILFYVYGMQGEFGATASSFIPTTGTDVTRAAESLIIPAANLPWPTPNVIGSEQFDPTLVGEASGVVQDGTNNNWTLTAAPPSTGAFTYDAGFSANVGKVYRIEFEIYDYVSGSVAPRLQGISGVTRSGNGIYTDVHTAVAVGDFVGMATVTTSTLKIRNISVKEIDPLSVSIQMNGRMTYADDGAVNTVIMHRWLLSGNDQIQARLNTASTNTGTVELFSIAASVSDSVSSAAYSPGVFVPFNIASRHGSTFVNGAIDGVALTSNTTPTALPDLSTTDLNLGYDFMGTIQNFQIWDRDIGDTGLVDETAPSLEPSLFLTFDGTTGSYTVTDWSE